MMKLQFRRKSRPPKGGFQYLHTETLHISTGSNYDDWLYNIRLHREANGLPPVSAQDAEDQNCMRLSPELARVICTVEGPSRTVDGVTLTLADIVRGTETIARFKLAGSPLVPQEEAERRAEICRRCVNNAPFVSPCGFLCQQLTDLVQKVIGGAKTAYDEDLKSCAVCRCSLPAKVHVPLSILRQTEEPEHQALFPEFCWQKAGNEPVSE